MSSGSCVMFLSCRCTGSLVFLCCHPGRLARDVATVLKWEGPNPYLVLTYVKWVMGDVSVMQVYSLVFLCCHPGRLSRDGPKVGGAKPIPCAHICQVGHV